jgi:hypothetical protein
MKLLRAIAAGFLALALGPLITSGATVGKNPATDGPEVFFGLTNLYTIHLTIQPDQWAKMETFDMPAEGGPPGMEIDFKEGRATLEFDGKRWGDIQVRFKGNSSFRAARFSLKRSLKLDFNDVVAGQKFFGLTKLNLNNNAMDPVQIREALAYDIARTAGLPASRTAFARVFVTVPGKHARACAGLYTVVEQVDERFLKAHYGTKQGLLLKPERTRGLPYLGDNWTAYEKQMQPKTKAPKSETDRCIQFFRLVNQADDAAFNQESATFMDVDEYLRFLALQTVLANLDSPLMTGHNFYLYLHPARAKFHWIPWDLNEAFGGFPPGGTAVEQAELSIDQPFTQANRLAARTLAMSGARERYHAILRGMVATNFNADRLLPLIDTLAAVVRPALTNDPTVTVAQFDRSLTGELSAESPRGPRPGGPGPGARNKPALKTFITKRVESLESQLAGKSSGYEPRQTMRPPGMGGPGPGGPGRPGGGFQPFPPGQPRER